MKSFLTIGLFLINLNLLLAQEIFPIINKFDSNVLPEKYLSIYIDSTKQLNYDKVLNPNMYHSPIDFEKIDFKKHSFWLRFSIKNYSSNSKWLLEILNFDIEDVEFYDIKIDSLIRTGYSKKFDTRFNQHKNYTFDLAISEGETKTYLVRLSSPTAFRPVLKISSYSNFISYSNKEYILLGVYYGLLIFIVTYNLFIFFSIKDRAYLYFILYILSIGFNSLQWDGIGFQYLWSSYPIINKVLLYAPQLLLITFSAYSIHFLELRKKYSYFYYSILLSIALYFILFIAGTFFPISITQLYYFIPYLIIFGVSIHIYFKGDKSILFFVLGNFILILSNAAHYSILNGIQLQSGLLIILFIYSLNIGFIFEAYIFSIALSEKIKWLKKQKDEAQQLIIDQLKVNEELKNKVNQELEIKVSDRTKELEEAKLRLQEQAEKINNMNRLLDLENYKLKNNITEINQERSLLKIVSFEEFEKNFPNENACYRFIEELKWGNGFICYKCNNPKYTKGNELYSRRCTKCNYIETIQANTIFHNTKFPIEKAFQMIYLLLTSVEKISSHKLAGKLKLQQKTCWSFSKRISDKMEKAQISKIELMEKGWSILIKE
jgi:two-component system, sensor histidine kinase LadS